MYVCINEVGNLIGSGNMVQLFIAKSSPNLTANTLLIEAFGANPSEA